MTEATPMTHVVIELGETNLWVSVHAPDGRVTRPPLVAGGADGQFPAALRVTASGRWFWGAHLRHGDDEVLVTNILSRVDDPVPIVVGGSRVPAAYLVAQQVATVYRAVATGDRYQLDLVHPADLSERGRATVESELRRRLPAGTPVAWVSRVAAAVTAVPECNDLAQGDVVGVLHVGGTTSEAVAWRQTAGGGDIGFAHVDRGNAGHALDDTLVAALLPAGSRRPEAGPLDVAHLRQECAHAKVVLSSQTAADIDVAGRPVRLVRGEVEELTRRLLTRQLDTLAAVLALQPADAPVRLVVLVGGGAGAPYLVEAASERFDVPVLSVPRVGDALPPAALPVAPGPPTAEAAEQEDDAHAEVEVAEVAARRPWRARGVPTRLRRRSGRTPVAPDEAVPAPPGAHRAARPARVLVPRPLHLAVAALALVGLWAGVQTLGLSGAGEQLAASAAAADSSRPLGVGVRAAEQGPLQGPGSLAFTPGGPTYTVPPWLAGSDPTGATLGPGGHALSMIAAGGSPSAVGSTSSTTSPSSTTTTPAPKTTSGAATPSSAASTPAAKGTTPASAGSGSTPAKGGASTPAPAASNPAPAGNGAPGAVAPSSSSSPVQAEPPVDQTPAVAPDPAPDTTTDPPAPIGGGAAGGGSEQPEQQLQGTGDGDGGSGPSANEPAP